MRICPGNPFNDLYDDNPSETFIALLKQVNALSLAYLHVIRMKATGIDNVALAKAHFTGPIVVNDSYKLEEAQQVVTTNGATAVSFGRWFVANPDLVERLRSGAELNRMDGRTLYSPGPEGYVDYQMLS
jgi:N-ethylmaleimide reductase